MKSLDGFAAVNEPLNLKEMPIRNVIFKQYLTRQLIMCVPKSSGDSGKCLGSGQRTLYGFPDVLKFTGGGRCGKDKELKVCPTFRRYLTVGLLPWS